VTIQFGKSKPFVGKLTIGCEAQTKSLATNANCYLCTLVQLTAFKAFKSINEL
jgi:hypothetical protein